MILRAVISATDWPFCPMEHCFYIYYFYVLLTACVLLNKMTMMMMAYEIQFHTTQKLSCKDLISATIAHSLKIIFFLQFNTHIRDL